MQTSLFARRFWSLVALAMSVAPWRTVNAIGLIARGKRLRGWNRICRIAATNRDFYRYWIRHEEPSIIADRIGGPIVEDPPSIAAVIFFSEPRDSVAIEMSTKSVRRAFGPDVRISEASECLRAAIEQSLAFGDVWILPIFMGDCVSPSLGAILNAEIAEAGDEKIIYWDEDRAGRNGRCYPWIKPDWDPLLFSARDCVSGAAAFRSAALHHAIADNPEIATGRDQLRQLSLALTKERHSKPRHIPLILTHRSELESSQPGGPNGVEEKGDFAVFLPAIPASWPKVSILIPTKDRGDLLAACVLSLDALDYQGALELVIIDNGTAEPRAAALLRGLSETRKAIVINAPGPFNFSALNNRAARHASGEFLCLLNNDVEAIDGSWLETMVRHAMPEDVGAVGAQLLYPDGRIQHAGVAIGICDAAGHVEKFRSVDDRQMPGWHSVTREVSAVTAACLLVRRKIYEAVGGLDEELFPVAFNDVDFCLRLKAEGYRNLMIAEARLVHHESVSRGDDFSPENFDRFQSELANLQRRWKTKGFADPHFSPLFAKTSEQCILMVT